MDYFDVPKTTWKKTSKSKHPVGYHLSKGGPTIPFVSDCAFADTAQIPQRFLLSTAVVYECVSERTASSMSL